MQKKDAFLKFLLKTAQFLEGRLHNSSSLHFGSCPHPAGQGTPPFWLKLLPGALAKLWHLHGTFLSLFRPQGKNFYLRLRPLTILRADIAEKALLTALRTRSIVSAGLLQSSGRKTKMEEKPTCTSPQTVQGKEEKRRPAALCGLYKHKVTNKRHLHKSADRTTRKGKEKDTCRCLQTLQPQGKQKDA